MCKRRRFTCAAGSSGRGAILLIFLGIHQHWYVATSRIWHAHFGSYFWSRKKYLKLHPSQLFFGWKCSEWFKIWSRNWNGTGSMSVENGRLSQNYDSDEVYCSSLILLAFKFTFRAFNRHFCPKRLTTSASATRIAAFCHTVSLLYICVFS